MQELIDVTGIVIKAIPVGEYDKAVTILTKERGKISAFARNSRKMNNKLMASSNPFCFGIFKLYPGRTAYTISGVEIQNYFEQLRTDLEGAYYGLYFLEVADYYTRENNDEKEMLKLVYQSLRALCHEGIHNALVKIIFECKAMAVNGEFPGVPEDMKLSDSAQYTLRFIASVPIEQLYTFKVTDSVLRELSAVAERYCYKIWNHKFNSLDILHEFLC